MHYFIMKFQFFIKCIFQGLELMKAHGITVHPTQLTTKSKEMGKDHDKTPLQWKSTIEQHKETVQCLKFVKQCLQSLEYLPELP